MTDIKFEAKLVSKPTRKYKSNEKNNDWQETSYKWDVSINDVHFEYYTGIGCLKKPLEVKNCRNFEDFINRAIPKPPNLDNVLYSLISDAEALDEGFEDWCSGLGFDTDSRKALEIYLKCQENGRKLRQTGINIESERERLQDY